MIITAIAEVHSWCDSVVAAAEVGTAVGANRC
mgnify:CR=1 FL=1